MRGGSFLLLHQLEGIYGRAFTGIAGATLAFTFWIIAWFV